MSRRDFLKLASLVPASYVAMPLLKMVGDTRGVASGEVPNVIVIVFDAWSALNVSFLGYPRETMPNLAKFAEKATVYHNHYSAGTFTVPGTASLLTGLHPWSHRALQLGGRITARHVNHQIFAALNPGFDTLGYAQNKYADQFLYQADRYLDTHIRTGAFNIQNKFVYSFFKKDARMAFASFEDNIIQDGKGYDGSLFLAPIYRLGTLYDRYLLDRIYRGEYPRGVPDTTEYYLLKDIVNGAIDTFKGLTAPNLVYMHFHPPHDPYRPKKEFWKKFKDDGLEPIRKDIHPLSIGKNGPGVSNAERRFYDEFMASLDDEVGRLFDYLESSGILKNSYVVITSDHGEMFERGEIGHFSPLIYEPVMHVPLIISQPGQTQREDVHINTSSVDVLPTMAHVTGKPMPDWAEGQLLPKLGGVEDPSRSIYVFDAKKNSAFTALKTYSVSLTKDKYRLTHYSYPDHNSFEFYDLDSDPDEMVDLFPSQPTAALDMQKELMDKMAEVNRPYEHK